MLIRILQLTSTPILFNFTNIALLEEILSVLHYSYFYIKRTQRLNNVFQFGREHNILAVLVMNRLRRSNQYQNVGFLMRHDVLV